MNDKLKICVMTVEDFHKNAKPTDIFKRVQKELNKESGLIDKYALRRDKTWSLLANQVVGAEV
ncbi:MAG: hypothetical protein Q7R33_08200 [Nitrosarchaeum sp.]|nr:hypothetical protein [Nitrosarchaeum sp.]